MTTPIVEVTETPVVALTRQWYALPTLQVYTPFSDRGALPYLTVASVPMTEAERTAAFDPLLTYGKAVPPRFFGIELERHFDVVKVMPVEGSEPLKYTSMPLAADDYSGDWTNKEKMIYGLQNIYLLLYRTDVPKIERIELLSERPDRAKYPTVRINLNLAIVNSLVLR